ncbi:MAG TPA: membrane protein insertion efficiency factor YidD [Acidobacteria bacterium]|nr:membrane protein insertion efficiency factor YidD [Acidobacteriota bacterium]
MEQNRGKTIAARLFIATIDVYQLLFSQWFTGCCRFVPSCSNYGKEAIFTHGAVKGTWLAIHRLCRCHPLCQGGLDQVPTPNRDSNI